MSAAAELIRRGAELARSRKHAPASQLPPAGPPPAAELLLVGALLWPALDGSDPREVLQMVADDDVADVATAELLSIIRPMVAAGPVGPMLVVDELTRRGWHGRPVGERLRSAINCGAVPEAVRGYCCAVVAASLRRRVESAGAALTEAASSMHEDDLAPLAQRAAAAVVECAARLDRLRGER